jgi:hypothetical protein
MKLYQSVLIAVFVGGVSFYGGYTLANYRAANEYLPTAQRFSALGLSSFMLRSAEMLDADQASRLRMKLLAVAQSQIEPLQYDPPNFWTLLLSPQMLEEQAQILEEAE